MATRGTMTSTPLPGLPGSAAEAGTGTAPRALFDGLLDDATSLLPTTDPTAVLGTHRDHRAAWYGDVVGALRLPASAIVALIPTLTTRDHGVRAVLVADAPGDPEPGQVLADELAQLREARHLLLDDDRLEVVGVELTVPVVPDLASATGAVLGALDFSTPAWIAVPHATGWDRALSVLAEDGAENLALRPVRGAYTTSGDVAAFVKLVVEQDLSFCLSIARGPLVRAGDAVGPGLLNLLCAVRAALSGASTEQITDVLQTADAAPLTSALRAMTDADAAVVRVFLASAGCLDVAAAARELRALGLVAPDPLTHPEDA